MYLKPSSGAAIKRIRDCLGLPACVRLCVHTVCVPACKHCSMCMICLYVLNKICVIVNVLLSGFKCEGRYSFVPV